MDIHYVNVFGVQIWLDSFVMLLAWIVLIAGVFGVALVNELKTKK